MWTYIKSAAEIAGSSPMFTWLQGSSRIELSGTTFLNAVSKAANFLADGLEVDVEQPVFVDLGNHWQSPVWTCAVVATGAVLSETPVDVNIVNIDGAIDIRQPVVVSRDPFGMPERELPVHAINASAEVRGFGDYFAPRSPTSESTVLTLHGVNVQQAKEIVAQLGGEFGFAAGQSLGVALTHKPQLAITWHCFVSVFNQSSMVLLDGPYQAEVVEKQERISHIIDVQ